MPQLANIVVKKNDGTTDVTYTGVVPSAGDKSPAIWRNNGVGAAAAFRPELTLTSAPNGTKTARRVAYRYVYPSTAVGSDGKTNVVDRFILEGTALVPMGMADVDVNEGVAQSCNLLASSLIKSSIQSGFAPT
nr:MAG: hypothetical protein [Sanya fiers-like virus 19]